MVTGFPWTSSSFPSGVGSARNVLLISPTDCPNLCRNVTLHMFVVNLRSEFCVHYRHWSYKNSIRSYLKTYGLGPQKAFESLCNHIFEEWAKSEYLKPRSVILRRFGETVGMGLSNFTQRSDMKEVFQARRQSGLTIWKINKLIK